MSETPRLAQLRQLVRTADRMATDHYNSGPAGGRGRGWRKPDGSWVTPADGAIESFLRRGLTGLFRGDVGIFGEEQGWSGPRAASYTALLDPIDGTAAFRSRIPVWGISLALLRRQARTDRWEPFVGIFSMPAAGQVFLGAPGTGALWNAAPLTMPPIRPDIEPSDYLGVSSDAQRWNLGQYPGKLRSFGVSGYEVILVATGALQASFLTRFHFYDIAAAAIVLWQAGGGLYRLSGAPVTPTDMVQHTRDRPAASEAPIIACHPARLKALLAALPSTPT